MFVKTIKEMYKIIWSLFEVFKLYRHLTWIDWLEMLSELQIHHTSHAQIPGSWVDIDENCCNADFKCLLPSFFYPCKISSWAFDEIFPAMASISLAPVFDIARVLLMTLVPISLVLLAQQRILTPLYGSYPALYHLNTVAFIAISASALSPFRARKRWNWLAASFLLTVAPNASYWVAVWTARKGWILLGPALVHAAVVAPLLFVFTSILVQVCIMVWWW